MNSRKFSRRDMLKVTGGLALTAALPRPERSLGGMWSSIFGDSARTVPPITPNEKFYITSYRTPPFILAENWSLSLNGLVKNPINISYSELLARPRMSEIVTLECVGNGVAGEAIGTAEWEGVSLKTVLDEVGIESKAYDVVFRAADGYSNSFTLERAMIGDVLIAHRMNGETLPSGHGYPARIIVPGVYGMKHVQ